MASPSGFPPPLSLLQAECCTVLKEEPAKKKNWKTPNSGPPIWSTCCTKAYSIRDNWQRFMRIPQLYPPLNGDIGFKGRHHLSVIINSKQIATSITDAKRAEWCVLILLSTRGRIDIRGHKQFVLYAITAEAGDTFFSLDTESPVIVVHKYNFYGEKHFFQSSKIRWRMK
ncbi:hypothetical protein BGX38DRAFT_1138960 [Terfezia claveryi]|nr:hypothetical protein BGX38DRAFT_1138960 [Terfezia claveryi]